MEIPKTTKDKPYIEFRFDKKGKIKLSATSIWWGKNAGFLFGNLKTYLYLFKKIIYIPCYKSVKIKRHESIYKIFTESR